MWLVELGHKKADAAFKMPLARQKLGVFALEAFDLIKLGCSCPCPLATVHLKLPGPVHRGVPAADAEQVRHMTGTLASRREAGRMDANRKMS